MSIEGDTVTVTLAAAVRPDELVSAAYVKPASGMLRDALHYTDVSSFDHFRVETVEDVTGPTLTGAVYIEHPTVSSSSNWTLYFDEALDPNSVPAAADFVVTSSSTAVRTPQS